MLKMLDRIESIYVGLGLALRVFLVLQTRIRNYFEQSGEFVTPLSSWKRGRMIDSIERDFMSIVVLVIEGIYLRKLNLSPFTGSIVHEVGRMKETRSIRIERSFRHHCHCSSIRNYMQSPMDMSKDYSSFVLTFLWN